MSRVATKDAAPPSAPGPTSPSTAHAEVGSVVDYLARTGAMYKQHVELLRQQQAAQESRAAPFRPKVTAYAEAAARRSQQRRSETIEERLHHLHEKRLEREREQREARERAEAAEAAALPFAPQISRRAAAQERGVGVVQSTWEWQAERERRLAERQQQLAAEEMVKVQDRPHISAYAQSLATRDRPRGMPVEDYLALREERRRRELYALTELQWSTMPGADRSDASAGASTTLRLSSIAGEGQSPRQWFSPAISAHAARLRRPGAVSERLYRSSLESADAANLFDEVYETRCTFQPALSSLSRQLSRTYYEAVPSARGVPVYERLYRNPAVTPKYRKRHGDASSGLPPHQPQINERSRLMAESLRERDPLAGGESPGSRLHRAATESRQRSLHTSDGAASTGAQERTFKKRVVTPGEREAAEETTFRPRVSARSAALWERRVRMLQRDGTARSAVEARELLWRQGEKQREERVRRARALREAREMLECTFRPPATRPPVGRPGYDGAHSLDVGERATLWTRQREQRLARLRAELSAEAEDARAAECTFRPAVHATYPLPAPREGPGPGEDAFLERHEEARRRRVAAERWWRPRHHRSGSRSSSSSCWTNSSGRRGSTAMESFELRTTRRAERARGAHGTRPSHHGPAPAVQPSHGGPLPSPSDDDVDEDDEMFEPHYPRERPLTPQWGRGEAGNGGGHARPHVYEGDSHRSPAWPDDLGAHHQRPQQPQQPRRDANGAAVMFDRDTEKKRYRPASSTWHAGQRTPSVLEDYQ